MAFAHHESSHGLQSKLSVQTCTNITHKQMAHVYHDSSVTWFQTCLMFLFWYISSQFSNDTLFHKFHMVPVISLYMNFKVTFHCEPATTKLTRYHHDCRFKVAVRGPWFLARRTISAQTSQPISSYRQWVYTRTATLSFIANLHQHNSQKSQTNASSHGL